MQHSESLKELGTALAKAHAELDNVTKDAKNPHFKSSYATLAAITDTTRPVLAKHGLSLIQMPSFADGVVYVETMLLHSSGEWISETAGAPAPKQDPQGIGSAVTYLRRYAQSAFCNIAQEDDDGTAASQPHPVHAQQNGHARKASAKQVEFLTKLAGSSVFNDEEGVRLMAAVQSEDAERVSRAIEWAKATLDERKAVAT